MKRRHLCRSWFFLFLSVAVASLSSSNALELTTENFDEISIGKTVFLKFYEPECPHCMQMEPAWQQLEEHFRHSQSKLIASVDCTSEEGYRICEDQGIDSFPTLLWGDVYALQEYEGPRDFESLQKFSDKHLKPFCSVNHIQLCDKATRTEIRRLQKLSLKELDKEMAAKTEEYNDIERDFKTFVDELEAQFEKAKEKKDEQVQKIKESGLLLMKAVEREAKE